MESGGPVAGQDVRIGSGVAKLMTPDQNNLLTTIIPHDVEKT
jgi:hypothetical protein